MQYTFLDTAGKVLFLRDDAERAELAHEEMTLNADFPYISGKEIANGQRIYFRTPSTNTPQVYEVRQAKTLEPDAVQQIIAEHICIAELTDEHIDNAEFVKQAIKSVLQSVLKGTLWSVGTVETNPTSDVNISRGSVWQAVLQIRNNFNVYIEPNVTLSDNGTITRKLDVRKTSGTWNGLRLSIDKNLLDPAVTIDDTNVATALFGYGGIEIATEQGQENKEINFSGVVWSKTSDHPAKPKGQKYIEDPDATKNFGRNGRPRYGYYQNTEILDPNILLQKTWEALQACNTPDVSVDGTIADLYRMGYADQPIRLHDIALVEVSPAGFKKQIQIIKFNENLVDPSGSLVTIGSYIPNIIYFEKRTNEEITGSPCGSGGGGGGGGGNRSKQTERQEFETKITANNEMIQLRAYQNDLNDLDNEVKLQEGRITVEHNRITAEVNDRRDADKELSGKITVQANKISLVVEEKNGKYTVNTASIVAGINAQSGSYVKIKADYIDLKGYVTISDLSAEIAKIQDLTVNDVDGNYMYLSDELTANMVTARNSLYVGDESAQWMDATIPSISISQYKNFQTVSGTTLGAIITSFSTFTIHYLGHS